MKKVISVREILVILISVLLIMCTTEVFALNPITDGNNNTPNLISGDDYNNAFEIPNNTINNNTTNETENYVENNIDNNTIDNNSVENNTTNNSVNNTRVYNTNNTTDLPQTGIEDYNIGILLIICIASAMYAYRKITDYRSI